MPRPELTLRHPVSERNAAVFHAAFCVLYAVALWFHASSMIAHWGDR